jgi:hypothetical protein
MMQSLFSIEKTKELIEAGAVLLVAGEEALLSQLPSGNWIGGTTPYFLGPDGGTFSREKVFVTELPDGAETISIESYDKEALPSVYKDGPANGFSFIIIPGMSDTHFSFAMRAPSYPAFATKPLVGWIAGVDLSALDRTSPKVFAGSSGDMLEDRAVVMNVGLPHGKTGNIGIVNIFEQGPGEFLRFPTSGFRVDDVIVDGQRISFVDYLLEKKVDTKLPLVANFGGAMINTSFQKVDEEKREVRLYAPVFEGAEYRVAAPVEDYQSAFTTSVPRDLGDNVIFSCNCILNYLYSELEGKKTDPFIGPVTFGEIAYQLVNQTLVYLQILES